MYIHSIVPLTSFFLDIIVLSWIFKSFSESTTDAAADASNKIEIFNRDSLVDSWTTPESLENHRHRSFSVSGDYLVIRENNLKIHVFFLELAVASVVDVASAAEVVSAVDLRFKDLAIVF